MSAHNVASADGVSDRTVFLIKFSAEVLGVSQLLSLFLCVTDTPLCSEISLSLILSMCTVLLLNYLLPLFSHKQQLLLLIFLGHVQGKEAGLEH